jgi:hypothetical protein
MHPRFVLVRLNVYPADLRDDVAQRISEHADVLHPVARFGSDTIYELVDRERRPTLVRRWPAEALEGRKGFQIDAALSAGRAGTLGRLVVEMNGQQVAVIEGAAAEAGFSRFLPLAELPVVQAGTNELLLRAEYRFAGAAPHAIGTTGGSVCADIEVVSARSDSSIVLNGIPMSGSKGYRLVWLDGRDCTVVDTGSFNTSWFEDDSRRLAEFIDRIPAGSPVIVASEFDVSRRLTARAVSALGQLGLAQDLTAREGVLHAAVGVKGAAPGTAVEMVGRRARVVLGTPAVRYVQIRRLELR